MDAEELWQEGWQGGEIKQTRGPAENECHMQLKYRTYFFSLTVLR